MDESTSGPPSKVLGELFKKIIRELNLVNKFPILIQKYLQKRPGYANMTRKEIDTEKSSLMRDMKQDEMTWKTMITSLRAANIEGLEIIFVLKHRFAQQETWHHYKVRLNDQFDDDELSKTEAKTETELEDENEQQAAS